MSHIQFTVQMWDLYSRDRIDTKADIWVRDVPEIFL